MDEGEGLQPASDLDQPVAGPGTTCAVCGRSLQGVSHRGECPACRTPAALSLASWRAPGAPAPAEPGAMRVPRDLVAEDTLCSGCSFNLRSFPVDGYCPQCRTPVARTLSGVGAGGVLAQARPCVVCGYSLLGLPQEGACPECGTPVERSLRGPLLRYSSPAYLRTLHLGLFYGEVGIALKVPATVGLWIVMFSGLSVTGQTLMQLLQLVITGVLVAGWWMFTTPDPALPQDAPGTRPRRFVRVVLGLILGLELLLAGISYVPSVGTAAVAAAGGGGPGMGLLFLGARFLGVAVMGVLGVIALASYLAAMSKRVPSPTLQQRAELYRWLIPLLAGVTVFGVFCCPTSVAGIAAVVLVFVMIEPWRWALRQIRRGQAMEQAGAGAPVR